MIGARSAAMGFNRIVDAKFDAVNPRTADRELPSGRIGRVNAGVFVFLSSALLVMAAFFLNPLCFYLSPVALAVVLGYSFTKRFTALTHVFLGAALAIAPLGAWIAVTGAWDWNIFLMSCGVLSWVAGFDILYAFQDYEFDRKSGLYSLPARIGIPNALRLSRILHLITVLILVAVGLRFDLSFAYYSGVGLCALLLAYEQSLVKPTDLSKLNLAFFTMNGVIGFVYFFCTLSDILWLS